MGRKFGLGKYGVGSYDLNAVHPIILFSANASFVVNLSGMFVPRYNFLGTLHVVVNVHGNLSHSPVLSGSVSFVMDIHSLKEHIGPPWMDVTTPDIDWNPITFPDTPEIWSPVTSPDGPEIWVPVGTARL